ncbi:SDR family NAD(P)-dependent oxidoreductase [Kribbia dieselivorans]|uniref:SDR family NAD(P)-dependent oxidoreductase n=1 Tax=Kribbia dieselivorans TaxID=331526 RepID=UPI000837C33B|nr:SDR family oxidoreductase [Kribbia dieselivorans]
MNAPTPTHPVPPEYAGLRVLITGGSAGLGLATAEHLITRGARVAICGRDAGRLESAAHTLEAAAKSTGYGGAVLTQALDVTDGPALTALFDRIGHEWDGLDGLVNSAGVHTGGSFLSVTDEQWQADFELKLLAAIRGTRLAVPLMERAGGGSVVNVLSVYARFQTVGSMPSSVFRAAGLAMTNGASKELAAHGVRVNAILIGFVRSDQWVRQAAAKGIDEEDFENAMVKRLAVPMNRPGTSEEAAEAIAFFLSSRSSYLTGTSLNVDGGWSPAI